MRRFKVDPERWQKQRSYTAGYDEGYRVAVWFETMPDYEIPRPHNRYGYEYGTGFEMGFLTHRRQLKNVSN